MRKFFAILLVCSMILSITACSRENKDTMETLEEDSKEEATKDLPSEEDSEEENENLIPGGYFEEENELWGVYTESGGEGSIAVNTDEQLEVTIDKTGS